jgi:hypothetical protein
VAGRWYPAQPVDPASTTLPIRVEAGACVEPNGTNVTTQIVSVDVTETAESVEIVVWTREKRFLGMCAGVGIEIDATAVLDAPLNGRTLLDAGCIPPLPVTGTR